MTGTPRPEPVFTKQQRIAELARNCPDMAFTNLAHHIDMEWMLTAHARTRTDGAVGVDGQTAAEYEVNLEANLQNLLDRAKSQGAPLVPFLEHEGEWDGKLLKSKDTFVTAIGAGTTYPDYKPAPFIVSSEVDGVDMVTVVTEGIFSYCGVKLKIDTDRHLGPERNLVHAQGEPVGHVTTAEYGSQMLSIGGAVIVSSHKASAGFAVSPWR